MGIGPLLLYGLIATAPLVISDLRLSRTQFGLAASAAFLAAAVISGVAGRLVDRYSERTVMIFLYAGAGAAFGVAAVSHSYAGLLAALVLSGAAQALSNPVTNRLISAHVVARRRGVVTGVKQSGVQMAQFFAGMVLPAAAVTVGWRGALGACMALAAVGLAFSLRFLPTPAVAAKTDEPDANPAASHIWDLAAFACLTGAALQATNVYLPLYGYEALDLAVAEAGLIAAIVGAVGLAGRIAWGSFGGISRHPSAPMLILVGAASCGVVAIALSESVLGGALLWGGAVVFGATGIAANVVVMLALIRTTPLPQLGRASGVLAIGMYLGFAVGPVSFGMAVDSFGGYGVAWMGVLVVYVIAGLLVLSGRQRLGG